MVRKIRAALAETSGAKGYLLVFAGAVCISFSAFFVKDAAVDPAAVAFYRLLFGSTALFLIAALRRVRIVPYRATCRILVLAGVMFCCDLLTWHISIVYAEPGIATILSNFQVIFLALYGALVLKESLSLPQKLAIPLGLAGLALLLGLHDTGLPDHLLRGTVYGIISALFYSAYFLSLRRSRLHPVRLDPVANIAWVTLFAMAAVAVYCLAAGVSLAIPDLRTGLTLAALGILCQTLGWFILSLGVPLLPPFRAGLVLLAQPALSYLWEILFYDATPGVLNILGACLATAAIGMGVYSGRAPAEERRPQPEPDSSLEPGTK